PLVDRSSKAATSSAIGVLEASVLATARFATSSVSRIFISDEPPRCAEALSRQADQPSVDLPLFQQPLPLISFCGHTQDNARRRQTAPHPRRTSGNAAARAPR